MRRFASLLAPALVPALTASAGTMTFTPEGPTLYLPGDAIDFTVGLHADFGPSFDTGFTAVAIDIGINGGPTVSFEFSDAFLAAFQLSSVDPGTGILDHDLFLNAFSFTGGATLPFADVGTLTVDTTGAALGPYYDVLVSGNLGDALGGSESVHGSARIAIIPEPATLSLLALGAIGLIRRRKHA